MTSINLILSGAIATQCLVISMFFYRYSRKSADSFFRYFAFAFLLLATERVVWLLLGLASEFRPMVYLFRLSAFLLIISAVLIKNRESA